MRHEPVTQFIYYERILSPLIVLTIIFVLFSSMLLAFLFTKFPKARSKYFLLALIFVVPISTILILFIFQSNYMTAPVFDFSSAITSFVSGWPISILSLAFTFYVGLMVLTIPSRLEERVSNLSSAYQTPLGSFELVQAEALRMLESSGSNPGNRFLMIAGTPVFGVELDEKTRQQWVTQLRARITTRGETILICREWDDIRGATSSSLGQLCLALAQRASGRRSSNSSINQLRTRLLARSWEHYDDLLSLVSRRFTIVLAHRPPFGMVLSEDDAGQKTLLLFFARLNVIARRIDPQGFLTRDRNLIEFAETAFHEIRSRSRELSDFRTDEQRSRDRELFKIYSDSAKAKKCTIRQKTIYLHCDVFDPRSTVGTEEILKFFDRNRSSIVSYADSQHSVAADIGCGCGVIGIYLSNTYRNIIFSDSSTTAIDVTKRNCLANELGDERTLFILENNFLQLSKRVSQLNKSLLVFNYPLYLSPFRIYNWCAEQDSKELMRSFIGAFEDSFRLGNCIAILPDFPRLSGFSVESLAYEFNLGIFKKESVGESATLILCSANVGKEYFGV